MFSALTGLASQRREQGEGGEEVGLSSCGCTGKLPQSPQQGVTGPSVLVSFLKHRCQPPELDGGFFVFVIPMYCFVFNPATRN